MRFSKIYSFKKIFSTNDKAFKLASRGEPEGACVISERQTRGRGRLNRKWYSKQGNLYVSLILRPLMPTNAAPQLTFVAALAVKEFLEKQLGNNKLQLKWPNDVMWNGKKISGILTEMEVKDNRLDFVIIGIGINVNQRVFPKQISDKAISIYGVLGRKMSLNKVRDELLRYFEKWYAGYLKKGFSYIKKEWEERSRIRGRRVVVQDGRKKIEGIAQGLNSEGALLVKSSEDEILEIFTGDLLCY